MISTHDVITKHVSEQNRHLVEFAELDELREQAIERALTLCKAGQPFSVNEINEITAQIIAHARKGISPLRVYVTEEMVREYAAKS